MCEVISCVLSFTLGIIAGGVGLYYKLLMDIKAFEREYEPLLLLLKEKQNEI
jgi:hypothetical protein